MKGYTIQHSIELLERQTGSGSGGTAADVSYNNTSSGLVATNVQTAIDELKTDLGAVVNYSTTERVIGSVGDTPLYEKMIDCGALPNNTEKSVAHNISGLDKVYAIFGSSKNTTSGNMIPIPHAMPTADQNVGVYVTSTDINIVTGSNVSAYDDTRIILHYTKTAVSSTRSKKSK